METHLLQWLRAQHLSVQSAMRIWYPEYAPYLWKDVSANAIQVTLLQLNRHLDDDHKDLEEVEQDDVKNWFRKQMVKAKRFQPVAVLNQKLKGLEVFESNATPAPLIPASVGTAALEISRPDPDEAVTRTHWQRSSGSDACLEPTCGKPLGVVNGSVNCRKCGKLFCEEHTMYQMKLSRSAQYEPVRGFWCRACETCYKSREGYNDHNGLSRDHTYEFNNMRRKTVDRSYLEVTRLEKRLTKLTQLLTNPSLDQNAGSNSKLWPISGARNQRKQLEQTVVTWEDDASVLQCPFCKQEFSNYSLRRHHCRLCGRVVCGDLRTGCSSEVGLNVAAMTHNLTEKTRSETSLDVRICRDCKNTVFSKRDFALELTKKPPDLKAYEVLVQFERGIRLMLPKFQRLLSALQDPDTPPTPAQLTEASKVRKRLMDSFSQYDVAAKRILNLPTTSSTQQRLQKAVYQQASNFLHLHMLPLRGLPKVLKHASPYGTNGNRTGGALASIRFSGNNDSTTSSVISTMEAEEKELKERLIVLEEQKFLVGEMIADANKKRRFDEVSSLAQNVEDLSREIDQVNGMLAQLDVVGAYSQTGP
ncbi:MAG: carboxypeptidase Y-deficient [Geoglossum umbratile]|nr:MAG: carboxypeptidase Y-deficient [Geoglossum umbratile]